MSDRYDTAALAALSDAFADAASLHRSASDVAEDEALRSALAARSERLEGLSRDCRVSEDADSGTALKHLDRLKLAVDTVFADKDEAAVTATREAIGNVSRLLDRYLQGSEISSALADVLADMKRKLPVDHASVADGSSLTDLPN